ncbi:MAG: dihydroorotase [Chloroflexi bacterium]|nr:dihydroorotase [Chloroflexota bacterium]
MREQKTKADNGTLLIRGGRVIDPAQGLDDVLDVLVRDGLVAAIRKPQNASSTEARSVVDASGLVVSPGFIDLHCHLREPGYEDKETIATGTLAAARGGFTAVCAMPNTLPPIDSRSVVEFVLQRAREEGHVRVFPIGSITRGRKGRELTEMAELAKAGAVGFSDDGDPVADPYMMRMALTYSRVTGLPLIEHCETPELSGGVIHEGWVASRLGLKGIPSQAEEAMVARDLALAELTGGRLHLAHLSTRQALELVRRAKERGLPVTFEVTPHHLTLTEEEVLGLRVRASPFESLTPLAYDTNAKVNPPLRAREDVQALVAALREGLVDAIATDHAPHTLVDKVCPFDEAAFGISGLETALGLVLTIYHQGQVPLSRIVEKLTVGPALVLGAKGQGLGTLKPGTVADLVIFDPEEAWTVDPQKFASKGKNTPLAGVTLKGRVKYTVLEGKVIYDDGR